ncbi:metallophosphoesterase family protein [Aliamphritea spongicola]|nr:metallophosphoesterase family protein [Aliamphritea spongicola]
MQEFSPADTKPLLIFGGPYSNLAATKAIKETSEKLEIPAGNILCTGDIVAYCASPQETTDLIREWGIAVVQGNCEESLGNGANDCGCGFDEGSTCDLLSAGWFNFAKPRVSADAKTWMATLPAQISFTWAGLKMHAIHGGLNSINQFIFASDVTEQAQQQTDSKQISLSVVIAVFLSGNN